MYLFNVSPRAEVGNIIGQVEATDPDQGENGLIRYAMKNETDNLPIIIDPYNGNIILREIPIRRQRLVT